MNVKLSYHPLNLTLRFILEMIALVALGIWGWSLGSGFTSYFWACGIPFLGAAIWGMFRVPGDASHSGNAPVPIPGVVRLVLELGLFTSATVGLFQVQGHMIAIVFAIVVGVHYLISWDRVLWLFRS